MTPNGENALQAAAPSSERVAAARQRLDEAGVEYIFCNWIDLLGVPKTKPVPASELGALCRGEGPQFAVHSVSMVPDLGPSDPDQIPMPDLDTLEICPWDARYAWLVADLYHGQGGAPYHLCPRLALKRQIERAAEAGYKFFVGFEPEFTVLRYLDDGQIWKAFDDEPPPGKGFRAKRQPFGYDTEFAIDAMPFLSEIVDALNKLGWGVRDVVAEGSYSQYELDFGYADSLTTADRFIFLRQYLKEVAKKHGLFVTFMPKVATGDWRNGSHINTSVQRVDRPGVNLLEDAAGGWSEESRHMLGGLIKHGAAIIGFCCPTVNSYKGLIDRVSGLEGGLVTWAPTHITYGTNNRSAMYRLPQARHAIENRAADLCMNVYLALAMTIAASLDGLENRIEPGPPTNESLYDADPAVLRAAGVKRVPTTLGHTIEVLEANELAREVVGEVMLDCYLRYKRDEWNRYCTTVTEWEREEYLRFF